MSMTQIDPKCDPPISPYVQPIYRFVGQAALSDPLNDPPLDFFKKFY
jgi:hypothetical protein